MVDDDERPPTPPPPMFDKVAHDETPLLPDVNVPVLPPIRLPVIVFMLERVVLTLIT